MEGCKDGGTILAPGQTGCGAWRVSDGATVLATRLDRLPCRNGGVADRSSKDIPAKLKVTTVPDSEAL